MAPYLQEQTASASPLTINTKSSTQATHTKPLAYEPGRTIAETHENYAYDHLLPTFPDLKWDPLEEVPYHDKGILGSPSFSSLTSTATSIRDFNPRVGTEVTGIDLASLSSAQKNDIARLISTRGVVFFRNQKNFDIEAQRELGKYFGTLHRHATTSVPKQQGLEDVHVVFAEGARGARNHIFSPSFLWHSDVTYEIQPPSYTSLKLLAGPPSGGGGTTLWSSQYAAYDALSPHMQTYLSSLSALHTADMQAADSVRGNRPVRRDPVTTIHPLIRVHPVTGWKSLFYNPGFVTKIVGVPRLESDHIISYLNELIATTNELHVSFDWGKDDVAFWDNRICNHSATYGFAPHRRHAVRVATHGEKPYYSADGKSQEAELNEKYGLPTGNKDCSGVGNYND
ncbi:TauD-domain-containing protein [Aureobasidium sp. EXF-8845]|nr:TauD-domain-containing protein [Aureobasidium sp. EXF-8845]KAI4853825.1 TauD-domain-containing protein [Aureobasidium sp. EXF-8846]